jgi:hypothetical protein
MLTETVDHCAQILAGVKPGIYRSMTHAKTRALVL